MNHGYLYINDTVYLTLIAISEEEQAQGLMGEPWPPPVMSFVYETPRVAQFWMKNTPSPLDIVFSHNGAITQICYGEPHSTSMIGDYRVSDLIVELPHGTVDSSGFKVGHKVGLVAPTLAELKRLFLEKRAGIF